MNTDAGSPRGVALVGYRGTGKSTVGRLVADRLGRAFVDADDALREHAGLSIPAIFERFGEPRFRDLEEEVLAALTARPGGVLATGGGAVLRESNRQRLRDFGLVVWLSAPAEVLAGRLTADPDLAVRPALTPAGTLGEIDEVLTTREPLYRAAAHAEVSTHGRTPEEVAEAVLRLLPAE
jgi:shikimate kinase